MQILKEKTTPLVIAISRTIPERISEKKTAIHHKFFFFTARSNRIQCQNGKPSAGSRIAIQPSTLEKSIGIKNGRCTLF